MNLDLSGQIQLGGAAQTFAQNFFLDLELMFVAGVLVVASSAAFEVLAAGLNAVRRRFEDRAGFRASEAGFLLGECSFDFFCGEDERDKYGLAASFIVGRQMGQAVATVDQLFDCEEQEVILRHGKESSVAILWMDLSCGLDRQP